MGSLSPWHCPILVPGEELMILSPGFDRSWSMSDLVPPINFLPLDGATKFYFSSFGLCRHGSLLFFLTLCKSKDVFFGFIDFFSPVLGSLSLWHSPILVRGEELMFLSPDFDRSWSLSHLVPPIIFL